MINPYFMFDGNCGDAITFYEKVFETKALQLQKMGDLPPNPNFPVPEEAKNNIVHCLMDIYGSQIMLSDGYNKGEAVVGNKVAIGLTIDSEENIKRIFDELKKEGTAVMELEKTFFAKAHGSVVDKFGVKWLLTAM